MPAVNIRVGTWPWDLPVRVSEALLVSENVWLLLAGLVQSQEAATVLLGRGLFNMLEL